MNNCPTCGSPVKIEGDVTMYYVPMNQKIQEEKDRWLDALVWFEISEADGIREEWKLALKARNLGLSDLFREWVNVKLSNGGYEAATLKRLLKDIDYTETEI